MRVKGEFVDTGDTLLTLTITAPIEEWRELMRQQPTPWPCKIFGNAIADAIGVLHKQVVESFEVTT